jgi:hypothetical protein
MREFLEPYGPGVAHQLFIPSREAATDKADNLAFGIEHWTTAHTTRPVCLNFEDRRGIAVVTTARIKVGHPPVCSKHPFFHDGTNFIGVSMPVSICG